MKPILFLFLITLNISIYAQESGIIFTNDSTFEQVLARSKAEGKDIFIDCYTTYCGPCKILAKEVFTQKEVGDFYNKHFINFKIDMQTPEGIKIKEVFNVDCYPTLLYLNANGELLLRSFGGRNEKDVIYFGEIARDTTKNYLACKKNVANEILSEDILFTYFVCNMEKHDKDSLISKYFNSLSLDEKYQMKSLSFCCNFSSNIEMDFFNFLYKNRKSYINKFGVAEVYGKIYSIYNNYLMANSWNSNKSTLLMNSDSLYYSNIIGDLKTQSAYNEYENNIKDFSKWNNFISTSKEILLSSTEMRFNSNNVCWTILENYKQFNDTIALDVAKKISYNMILEYPDNPMYINTYAHVLYELGYITDAIKYEENALKEFEVESNLYRMYKSSELLGQIKEYYNSELEKFRRSLQDKNLQL